MLYTLMNKNTELLDLDMDKGTVLSIKNVREENRHLLPIFIIPPKGQGFSRSIIGDWWSSRRIPASRGGIKELLWHLDNISLDYLAEKSLGLSLSDQYWIRPDESITWDKVNFFENDFSDDIGKLLITGNWENGSLLSPDNTSDGVVKKKWALINGKRCLIKGSFGEPWQAQPFREVFASKIAKILFDDLADRFVVDYWIIEDDGLFYSVCPNFITSDTEYVSMNQINQAYKKPNNISHYDFCKSYFGAFGNILDLTLLLDYIVLNEDRHFGNFGVIRDVSNGEILQPAPLFDTGSSLFYDSTRLNPQRLSAKPFSKTFNQQIKYVDIAKYTDNINQVKSVVSDIFWESFLNSPEDKIRLNNILKIIIEQINYLLKKESTAIQPMDKF